MEDTRSGGKARRGAGEQERAGTQPAVVGDGTAWQRGIGCWLTRTRTPSGENWVRGDRSWSGREQQRAGAEYRSADGCGRSGRAAGCGNYRGYRI